MKSILLDWICEYLVWFLENTGRAQGVIEDRDGTAWNKTHPIAQCGRGVVSRETVFKLLATAADL